MDASAFDDPSRGDIREVARLLSNEYKHHQGVSSSSSRTAVLTSFVADDALCETGDAIDDVVETGECRDGGVRRSRRLQYLGLMLSVFVVGCACMFHFSSDPSAKQNSLDTRESGSVAAGFDMQNYEKRCKDATKEGDRGCYDAVSWAMSDGINEHPLWYTALDGTVLTSDSDFFDFQDVLHREGHGHCPAPCSIKKKAVRTHDEYSKAGQEDPWKDEAHTEDGILANVSLPCSEEGQDCTASQCCKGPGMQCYAKNPFWAECMVTCTKGPRPSDPDATPWFCKELGERAEGDSTQCADVGKPCHEVQCCKDTGTQCYSKNSTYATCKLSCSPGPDLTNEDWLPWNCTELGPRKPGPAEWVAEKCSVDGGDCTDTGCCLSMGKACFEKQPDGYAACKRQCTPGVDPDTPWDTQEWTCKQLGSFTPTAPPRKDDRGKVAKWVENRCSGEEDDCSESRCCKSVNHACYRKNQYWSQCMEKCPHEVDPTTNTSAWTCEVLGPRSWGLATKGFPAIFCLSVMRVTGYEPDLIRAQLKRGFGIFACDGFMVIANGNVSLGYLPGSKSYGEIRTWPIATVPVGRSQDGTAANTLLFMKVWDAVLLDGRYRNYDWTIKTDPDAVVMADRLRLHVLPHNGENVYFVNCNAYPDSPNFPMMYGSLEVFSRLAMLTYSKGSGRCGSELPWKLWGEDYFMTHCLDMLGVGRIGDFMIIGDNVCTGANCADGWTAAFHPFKTVEGWTQCLNTALAAPQPSIQMK